MQDASSQDMISGTSPARSAKRTILPCQRALPAITTNRPFGSVERMTASRSHGQETRP